MKVTFRNDKTGELRAVKIGWSWTLFFFSGFLGIPLFLRRLYALGAIFLVGWAVNVIVSVSSSNQDVSSAISGFVGLILFGLAVWMAIKGNEYTAKNYLENGRAFSESDQQKIWFAKTKWGLS